MLRVSTLLVLMAPLLACSAGPPSPPPSEPTSTSRTVRGPATDELVRRLEDPTDADDAGKRWAATLLGLRRAPSAVEALQSAVARERSPTVRAAAVEALGSVGSPDSLDVLAGALKDPAEEVRRRALEALGVIPGARAQSLLEALARAKGPQGRAALIVSARRDGFPDVDLSDAGRFEPEDRVLEHAPGRIWFVDATSGDDGGAGDEQHPLETVGAAVLRMEPGDFVHATAGSAGVPFRERVLVPSDKGGSRGSPTRLRRWPGRPAPVLDGFGEDPNVPGPGIGLQIEGAFVTVEGWTVRGYDESGIHLGGAWSAAIDCTVERCERHGIFAYYAPTR